MSMLAKLGLATALGLAAVAGWSFVGGTTASADGDVTPPSTKTEKDAEKAECCGSCKEGGDCSGCADKAGDKTVKECAACTEAKAKCEKCVAAEKAAAEAAAAPAFTLKDTNGKEHSLKDFKGKIVVLEWINHGCPFVVKHYGSDNMQSLQRKYTEKGVVWLSICSSAEGKQGNMTGEAWNKKTKELKAAPTAILLDANGKVGQAYGAKTTPHMYVIDKTGAIVYKGGIDDKATANVADIKGAKNYVVEALDALLEGKVPAVKEAKAYGCSVKYAQ